MARQIDLDQLMKYPLRRGSEHCDEKNADPRFLNGVESILEWAQTLPTLTPPEIVCCQDCVHHEDGYAHWCNKWEHTCLDDSEFFCKFGRKKDGKDRSI